MPLLVVGISVLVLLLLMTKLRLNGFVALLLIAVGVALVQGIGLRDIPDVLSDGIGSAIQNPKRPDGMGWHTMRYRSNLIGAELSVHTEPGKGTEIRCAMPLAAVRLSDQSVALA